MNYKQIYDNIIKKAQSTQYNGHTENHHIIPKCLGGNNFKSNIVTLTYREHFICHWLLCKIYPDNFKLKAAFGKMLETNKNNQRIVSSKQFDIVKRNLKGTKFPWLEGNIPWNKGKKGLQVAWNKGIKTGPMSDEERAKRSISLKKTYSQQTHHRKGVEPWNKGKTGSQVAWNKGLSPSEWVCPHCGKVGKGDSNKTRWHFDNCKKSLTNK